jgi:hypothetical protein
MDPSMTPCARIWMGSPRASMRRGRTSPWRPGSELQKEKRDERDKEAQGHNRGTPPRFDRALRSTPREQLPPIRHAMPAQQIERPDIGLRRQRQYCSCYPSHDLAVFEVEAITSLEHDSTTPREGEPETQTFGADSRRSRSRPLPARKERPFPDNRYRPRTEGVHRQATGCPSSRSDLQRGDEDNRIRSRPTGWRLYYQRAFRRVQKLPHVTNPVSRMPEGGSHDRAPPSPKDTLLAARTFSTNPP